MPNVKYSGSKGIVQSTGSGQFHVSGVGIAHDVEEKTLNNPAGIVDIASHGPTLITNTAGDNTVRVLNPADAGTGTAGQQKLVVLSSLAAGNVTVRSVASNDLIGDPMTAAGDYCLLVWTGSDWVVAAEVTTA